MCRRGKRDKVGNDVWKMSAGANVATARHVVVTCLCELRASHWMRMSDGCDCGGGCSRRAVPLVERQCARAVRAVGMCAGSTARTGKPCPTSPSDQPVRRACPTSLAVSRGRRRSDASSDVTIDMVMFLTLLRQALSCVGQQGERVNVEHNVARPSRVCILSDGTCITVGYGG